MFRGISADRQCGQFNRDFYRRRDLLCESDDGYVYFSLPDGHGEKTELLVKSLLLGLDSIRRDYGTKYLKIAFREV